MWIMRDRIPVRPLRAPERRVGLMVLGAWGLLALGCSQSGSGGAKTAQGDNGQRDTRVPHEECKLDSAAEKLDANGDGKPDVQMVKEAGRIACYAVDLDFDGKVDEWVYLDPSGKVRRREFALSTDPAVNKIEIYRDGQLAEVQKSTVLAGKLDTWQFYEAGRPTRAERDSNGDGRIDQWWVFEKSDKSDCPMMYADANGDGKPDPSSGVNLCGGGYVPPERGAPQKAKSPSFERPGTLPTETDNKTEKAGESAERPGGGPSTGKSAASGKGK
jgi:hypothetical protein